MEMDGNVYNKDLQENLVKATWKIKIIGTSF